MLYCFSLWSQDCCLFRVRWEFLHSSTLQYLYVFPRIYQGEHYPTDIIAGALLGFGVGCIANAQPVRSILSREPLNLLRAKPGVFYALFFVLTYLIGSVGSDIRVIVEGLFHYFVRLKWFALDIWLAFPYDLFWIKKVIMRERLFLGRNKTNLFTLRNFWRDSCSVRTVLSFHVEVSSEQFIGRRWNTHP